MVRFRHMTKSRGDQEGMRDLGKKNKACGECARYCEDQNHIGTYTSNRGYRRGQRRIMAIDWKTILT